MKLFKAIAATACALAIASAAQAATYTDSSANYGEDWSSGSNGGEGFGPWNIETASGGDGWAGFGIWDPTANEFKGLWNGKTSAFGIIGKGAGYSVKASRLFRAALATGDSFQLDMGVNWDANIDGAHKGFVLTAGGADILEINHGNYPGHIYVNGDDSFDVWNETPTEEGEVLYPMTWKFTAKNATTLTVSANSRKDNTKVYEQDFTVFTAAIDGFRLQSVEQDNQNEDRRQSYYDNFVLNVAGELHDIVTLSLSGDWSITEASQERSFTLARSSSEGTLDVELVSSYPEFLSVPTLVTFADGDTEVPFTANATLKGSANSATITASAAGCNPATYGVRGPNYSVGVESNTVFAGATLQFWMDAYDANVRDESKVSLVSEPEGAIVLPAELTWNEKEDGTAYVLDNLTVNASGSVVLYYDGVHFGDYGITVLEPGFTISGPTSVKTGDTKTYTLTVITDKTSEPAEISAPDGVIVTPSSFTDVYPNAAPPATFSVTFPDTPGPVTLSVATPEGDLAFSLPVTVAEAPDYSKYVAYDDASLYGEEFDFAATGEGTDKFQAWTEVYSNNEGNDHRSAGVTLVGSAPDEAALSEGSAFALYANGDAGDAEIRIRRPFVNSLSSGQAFSVQISPNYRDGAKGVVIQGEWEGNWYDRVEFYCSGEDYAYKINGGEPVKLDWAYGTKLIDMTLRQAADGSAYTLSFAREGDETVTVGDLHFGGSVDGALFYSWNGGYGDENNFVFNRLAIQQVEEPVVVRSIRWAVGVNNPDAAGDYTFTIGASTDDIGEVALAIEPADGAASLSTPSVDLTGLTEASFTVTLSEAVAGDKFTVTATPVDTEVGALSYDIYPIASSLELKSKDDGWLFNVADEEIWLYVKATPSKFGTYTLQTSDSSILELSVATVTVDASSENGEAWFNVYIKGDGKATISLAEDPEKKWDFTITGKPVFADSGFGFVAAKNLDSFPPFTVIPGRGLAWSVEELDGATLLGTVSLTENVFPADWKVLEIEKDYVIEDGKIIVLFGK